MVDRKVPRVQEVVLPLLREALPGVDVWSWFPPTELRKFPFITVKRMGGLSPDPSRMDLAVIELTAFSKDGIVATEDLYLDARQVLYEAVQNQTVLPNGYLHSYFETMGPMPFDSGFEDAWRIQGLIQLGVRPRKNQ